MTAAIIILSVLMLALLGISTGSLIFDDFPAIGLNLGISILFTIAILILALSLQDKPKAIDVYKNKTTLEITYKEGVPIDSTVVWK